MVYANVKIRTCILLCSGTDIKQTAQLRVTNCSDLEGNVSHHQICYTLLCIVSLLHAVHISSGYMDLFDAQCTDRIIVSSVACNELGCQECSCCDVIRNITCHPLYRVCSCVNLTDRNFISAVLYVECQKFCRSSVDVQRIYNGVPKL
jgi:hypothetical protein